MAMAVSSLRLEGDSPATQHCDVDDGGLLGEAQSPTSSIADTYEMSEEFLAACGSAAAAATPKCGGNNYQEVVGVMSNQGYSSDGEDSEGSESNCGDVTMSPVLLENIKSWCEATGLPASITIHFKGCTFQLHKFPLVSKSGYLKRMLMKDAKDIAMPDECPGNAQIFDIVANFCYGSPVQMESSNVAELRCVAEFLEMTQEYGKANLCERSDSYLNQVALQSWQDTMVVLVHCPNLLPYAENLGIVNRCVECLAFLACIEMMDPLEKPASRHRGPSSMIESQFWSDISVSTKDTTTTTNSSSPSSDWWMDDLLRLPCSLFERVIAAIRTEGMQEKFVSQAIVKFVDRWVFTSSSSTGPDTEDAIISTDEDTFTPTKSVAVPQTLKSVVVRDNLVESMVRLLPKEKDAVPISFLFSLLRCALACNSTVDCRSQLESRIACQLELATISDFLDPFRIGEEGGGCSISAVEVSCMRRIVNSFMSQQRSFSDYPTEKISSHGVVIPDENFYCSYAVSAVAKVWDEYLAEVARDLSLAPGKFAEFVEVVPSYARATHDHLYKAIHIYLKVHPHFSQEERQIVCGILNCQKLSPEMCSHAVQNELMPLRMIVQAMFMQQLQTRNVLSGHLQNSAQGQSMRFDSLPQAASGAASWRRDSLGHRISTTTDSFRSSHESFRSRQNEYFRDESFGVDDDDMDEDSRAPLGFIMKREAAFRQAALLKADYLATETRLQNLEEELAFMRKKMGSSKQQQPLQQQQERQHPVSKCTSERFSGRKKKKESLTAVPEGVTTNSDAEDDDADDGGNVKFSARTGNGLGFLTRALRLITLGGFGRRKSLSSSSAVAGAGEGADGDCPAEDGPMYSAHMLCGGKGMWQTHNDDNIVVIRPKKETTAMSTLHNLVAQSSGLCGASANAVKTTKHKRRHSLS